MTRWWACPIRSSSGRQRRSWIDVRYEVAVRVERGIEWLPEHEWRSILVEEPYVL